MTVVRSAAVAVLIAASASLAPLPGSSTALADGSRCSAYQPGARTPERRQLMDALLAEVNRSPYRGTNYRLKKLWMACDYTRVQLNPRGRGQAIEVLMVKVNGEWKVAMIADPAGGPAVAQFRARHADIPDVLVYW